MIESTFDTNQSVFLNDPILKALQQSLSEFDGRSWYNILERENEEKRIRKMPVRSVDEWTLIRMDRKKLKYAIDDDYLHRSS